MTLRIYALYCSDRRILWFFGAAVVLAVRLTGVHAQKVEGALCLVDPGWDSIHSLDKSKYLIQYQGLLRIVGPWLALFVYDTIIFVLTAAQTHLWCLRNTTGLMASYTYLGIKYEEFLG
uniref:Uncharacterized protein n=1 Tax=Moniliophthora roreri TaxID=221103 RepID=A0A0W0FV17_MONRR